MNQRRRRPTGIRIDGQPLSASEAEGLADALTRARCTLGRRKGVVSVHWALRVAEGRSHDEVALAVMVESKLPEDELPARSRIPARVEATLGGRRRWVPTDALIHGVDVRVRFSDGTSMRGLIELEHDLAIGGDSGAPVADVNGRLVGFVVGSNGSRTYLLPTKRGLNV
ncbi:MAG: hypothetical protein H6712_03050 [Myxococcales bacterium]|nr:hypothetical protein [Myxococcales bacterium]